MDFSSTVASQLHAGAILPEGIVIVTIMAVLIGDLIFGRSSSRWLPYLAMFGLFITLVALFFNGAIPMRSLF